MSAIHNAINLRVHGICVPLTKLATIYRDLYWYQIERRLNVFHIILLCFKVNNNDNKIDCLKIPLIRMEAVKRVHDYRCLFVLFVCFYYLVICDLVFANIIYTYIYRFVLFVISIFLSFLIICFCGVFNGNFRIILFSDFTVSTDYCHLHIKYNGTMID